MNEMKKLANKISSRVEQIKVIPQLEMYLTDSEHERSIDKLQTRNRLSLYELLISYVQRRSIDEVKEHITIKGALTTKKRTSVKSLH